MAVQPKVVQDELILLCFSGKREESTSQVFNVLH